MNAFEINDVRVSYNDNIKEGKKKLNEQKKIENG